MKYTEEYEQSKAKGSFPAMITPGYQAAKQANSLASSVSHLSDVAESFRTLSSAEDCCLSVLSLPPQLEYKKGHEERVSKYTTFVDPPEVILAKKQGQIVSDVSLFPASTFV